MGLLSTKGRSGRGSKVPANVKLRPALPAEEGAQPRKRIDADSFAVIPRQEHDLSSDEDERDGQDDGLVKFENEKKPLMGMQVCTTGKLEVSREEVRRICHTLGARFEPALATNTTFLVSDKTEGDKYRAAVDNGIPVLHSAFLQDIHSKWVNAVVDIDVRRISEHYRLAPLHGLTICLTGYPSSSTPELRERISSLGGAAYSPSLNHEATHLVVGPSYSTYTSEEGGLRDNGKVLAAMKINARRRMQQPSSTSRKSKEGEEGEEGKQGAIQIVWGEWLEHSLLAFGRLEEGKYSVENVQDRQKVCENVKVQRSGDIVQRAQSPAKEKETEKGKGKRKRGGKLLREDTSVVLGEAQRQQQERRKRAKLEEESKSKTLSNLSKDDAKIIKNAMMDDSDAEDDHMELIKAKKGRSTSVQPGPATSMRPVMKKQRSTANAELLGVQDLLAPPSTASTSSAVAAVGAAPSVPIVKPSSSSSVPTMARDVKGKGKAKTVTATRTSTIKMESQQPALSPPMLEQMDQEIMPEAISSKPSASLLSNLGKSRTSKFSTTTANAVASTSSSIPSIPRAKLESQQIFLPSALPHQRTTFEQEDFVAEHPILDDVPYAPPPIFEGKTFLLHFPGVKGEVIKGIEGAVEAHGGRIARRDGPEVDYLVYRFAQTGKEKIDLEDPRIVSDVWLEACFFHEKIVEPEEDELIGAMTKPLQFDLPLLDADKYHLSYSGFDECSLLLCIKFCNALGLKHDKRMMRNVTTHLVIPNGGYTSTRLGAAQEWGVKIVYPEWLRGVAEGSGRSRRVKEEKEEGEVSMDVVDDEDRFEKVGVQDRKGPLVGCKIAVHRDLETAQLRDLINELGASYSHSFDKYSSTTHFIYQSKRLKDPNRDFKLAQEAGKHIVHPKWLDACMRAQQRLPEGAYKWTLDASRSLEIGLESQTTQSRRSSRKMSNASFGAEAKSTNQEEDENDEFALPPPLPRSSRTEAVFPTPTLRQSSMSGIAQSTPHHARVPASPPRSPPQHSLNRSSSATLCSPRQSGGTNSNTASQLKLRSALSEPNLEKTLRRGEDSGFVPSSTDKSGTLLGATATKTGPSTSSPTSSPRSLGITGVKRTWEDNDITLNASSDPADPHPTPVAAVSTVPTNTAITRDLLAEMNAIMDAEVPQHLNARLPYQQQGGNGGSGGGRAFRRMPMKRPDTSFPSSTSPKPFKAIIPEPRYESLFESQFQRGGETQTQHHGNGSAEDSMMVIRISDPTAEATKARMLAGIRSITAGASASVEMGVVAGEQEEDEETQKSNESMDRRTSRRTRA